MQMSNTTQIINQLIVLCVIKLEKNIHFTYSTTMEHHLPYLLLILPFGNGLVLKKSVN